MTDTRAPVPGLGRSGGAKDLVGRHVGVGADAALLLRVDALSARLRAGEPPVFARITEDTLRLDPRTLLEGDREELIAAFRRLAEIGH